MASTQNIQLSDIEILRRFSIMEKHFPRQTGKAYFESLDYCLKFIDEPEKAVKEEADKMLNYVGLGMYTSTIKVEKLTNAAGNIRLTDDMYAEITINEDTLKNSAKVLATLAHEICHKILYRANLFFDKIVDIENEIYADLATFYVGFGDLTLRGYKVDIGDTTHTSGYLSPATYAMAYVIISRFNIRLIESLDSLPTHAREQVKQAQKSCTLTSLPYVTKDNIGDEYIKICSEYSKQLKMLEVIEKIVADIKQKITNYLLSLESSFYTDDITKFDWNTIRINFAHATEIRRASTTEKETLNLAHSLHALNNYLNQNIQPESFNSTIISCPFCGIKIKKNLEERNYHYICPSCKKHFVIDNKYKEICSSIESYKVDYQYISIELKRLRDELYKSHNENQRLIKENKSLLSRIEKLQVEINDLYRKKNNNESSKGNQSFISRILKLMKRS